MTTHKDAIKYEYGMTEDQYIMFEEYCYQRYAARTWIHSDGPNDESFYISMSNESMHAAHIIAELAERMWNLDVRGIYNELTDQEVHDICFVPTLDPTYQPA